MYELCVTLVDVAMAAFTVKMFFIGEKLPLKISYSSSDALRNAASS